VKVTKLTIPAVVTVLITATSLCLVSAQAATLVVAADGLATSSDCDDPANADARAIQDAIAAASVGDTILVCSGTYTEKVTVDVEDLVLRGIGPTQPAVVGSGEDGTSTLTIKADGVTLDNFEVTGGGALRGDGGIRVDSDNNTIIGNTATKNKRAGIWVVGDENTIHGNEIVDNLVCGIVLETGSDRNDVNTNNVEGNENDGIRVHSVGNVIDNNVAHRNLDGINLRAAEPDRPSASGNVVTRNNVHHNMSDGIELRSKSSGNILTLNIVHENAGAGFNSKAKTSGNTIEMNKSDKNAGFGYQDASAGGTGTLATSNNYISNRCNNNTEGGSNPAGMCTPQS
jgi:parallel beta-helix repeat protein